ncbi:MAG: CD225/dispanin family protein [Flavobacteriaceae bacterium]|nr:CD225/dispanin family protein [Flavobacteriaceae bacterium]
METTHTPERPSNYLVPSILATIFCCLIPGIVSIVYASKVNSLYDNGDYDGALKASRNAKTWFWIAFGIGLLTVIGYAIYFAVVGAAMFSGLGEF